MSLVEGTSALAQTNEVANTLKVISETTSQSADIYTISNYLSETQASQPQAAATTYTYIESLKTYVPQVVTGFTAAAGGGYTAVSGGLAYILSAPVAFAAIASALGIGVGVGMYELNPEFWTKVSNALLDAGAIVGGGVLSILKDGKNYIPASTVNAVREVLLQEGAYNDGEGYSGYQPTVTGYTVTIQPPVAFAPDGYYTEDYKDGFNVDCRYALQVTRNTDPVYLCFVYSQGSSYERIYAVSKGYFRLSMTGNDLVQSPSWSVDIATQVQATSTHGAYYSTSLQDVYNWYRNGLFNEIPANNVAPFNVGNTDLASDLANYLFYNVLQPSQGGVEGLEKQSGATIPNEQTDIPTEFPDWWLDGIDFFRPITREIGNNPTNNPNDYEAQKAIPVEVPATIGSPIETGYDEPQVTVQGGEVVAPSVDPPVDPPTEPWKRIIKGTQTIIEPIPPHPPTIDVYPGPEDPPIFDPPPVEDPPLEDPPPPDPPTIDDGHTVVVTPPTTGTGTGMNNIYNPSKSEMQSFNAFLWSNDFVDTIKKILNDPMQAIIALQMVYVTPPTESGHTIVVGSIDTEISSDIVTSQYVPLDCGSVTIPEYFLDYTDYSPYTEIQCYLPFIGFVKLDPDDVINATLNIKYTVDLYTGACIAEITVTKGGLSAVLYTFNGNCAVQLPLTAATHSNIFGVISGISSTAIGVATGNPLMALGGLAAAGMSYGKQDISRSGSLGSNAGAMAIKKPYIVARRPIAYNASRYNEFMGIPSNTYTVLSNLSGYTRVKYCHVENIESATDNEKTMIESLLKQGVLI